MGGSIKPYNRQAEQMHTGLQDQRVTLSPGSCTISDLMLWTTSLSETLKAQPLP